MTTLLTPAQIKSKSLESRRNLFVCVFRVFSPGADGPHVYLRAWAQCCFRGFASTPTFRRALTAVEPIEREKKKKKKKKKLRRRRTWGEEVEKKKKKKKKLRRRRRTWEEEEEEEEEEETRPLVPLKFCRPHTSNCLTTFGLCQFCGCQLMAFPLQPGRRRTTGR